jgi:hypothetical protein
MLALYIAQLCIVNRDIPNRAVLGTRRAAATIARSSSTMSGEATGSVRFIETAAMPLQRLTGITAALAGADPEAAADHQG